MAAVVQRWTSAQARDAATAIVRALRGKGLTAYFAGGCVRDELLGFEPVDYDVATDARPDAIRDLFRRTAAVGASFGVVLVKEGGVTVEVASFRSDGPYSDRRRPDHVEYSDASHDAQRRDFTINALFLDPLVDGPGLRAGLEPHGSESPAAVIDFVGGLADLRAGVIRAVGDPAQRLAEDHLRALRAVRFAARYGFEIEPGTAEAIRRHAGRLEGVSRERIGEEFRRMLGHPSRAAAVRWLGALGLDRVLLGGPGLKAGGDALRGLLDRLAGPSPGSERLGTTVPACLACLAFDRGMVESAAQIPGLVGGWRGALCLTNEETDRLREVLIGVTEARGLWGQLPVSQRKRRAASAWFGETLAVVTALDPVLGSAIRAEVGALAGDGVGLAPEPVIGGGDLLDLGLRPGPVFARVLAAVYDAQLEGRVRDRSGALVMVRELTTPGGV